MKQQFKTDGLGLSNRKAKKKEKGLRNRKAMNEDRISELPDALLLQILSLLPTENVIATSVLSKRWRSVWKMVPKLKFDYGFHQLFENKDPHVYSENVYRCLTLHKAPVLESLHLNFEGKIDYMDVGIWIATAFARPVRKLVLVSDEFEGDQIFTLPSVLFTYNDTLEILKLNYAIKIDFPSRVCLKSLRKLCLYRVRYKDEESVSNFLCGCPRLEDLVVHRYSDFDVATFTIAVPSLQRLTIKDINEEGCFGNGGYVINAPALKYLHLKRFNDLKSCLIEKAPELVEAKMNDVSNITNENILESLTSAKRLTLHISTLAITVPTGKIFDQLVYLQLELQTHEEMWWELLSMMLESSPKLQILELSDLYHDARHKFPDERKWNPPKCVPECLLFHLETFVWKKYKGQRDEKEVATYILKNAKCLKKATFSTFGFWDWENLEKKRREMLNELGSVVRASDSCHLVFE